MNELCIDMKLWFVTLGFKLVSPFFVKSRRLNVTLNILSWKHCMHVYGDCLLLTKTTQQSWFKPHLTTSSELMENIAYRRGGESEHNRMQQYPKLMAFKQKNWILVLLGNQCHKMNLSAEMSRCIWIVQNQRGKDFCKKGTIRYCLKPQPAF